jgi:hypothetical protein
MDFPRGRRNQIWINLFFSKQREAGIWQFNSASGEEKLLIVEMDKWDVAIWTVSR